VSVKLGGGSFRPLDFPAPFKGGGGGDHYSLIRAIAGVDLIRFLSLTAQWH